MRNALARVAPGTPLRDGIDRVVRALAGALLVLSDEPDVLSICSGGFLVDAPYSPQRLSELAKMDGAIIISTEGGRWALCARRWNARTRGGAKASLSASRLLAQRLAQDRSNW